MTDIARIAVEEDQRFPFVGSIGLLDQKAVQFLVIRRFDGDRLVGHAKGVGRLNDRSCRVGFVRLVEKSILKAVERRLKNKPDKRARSNDAHDK